MVHEQVQQAGLQIGELQQLAVGSGQYAAVGVELKFAHLDGSQGGVGQHLRPAQPGFHLGHEEPRADRRRHAVIRPGPVGLHQVRLLAVGGHYQDRHRRLLPNLAAKLKDVRTGVVVFQDDQIGELAGPYLQGFLAEPGLADLQPGLLQAVGPDAGALQVVAHQEHRRLALWRVTIAEDIDHRVISRIGCTRSGCFVHPIKRLLACLVTLKSQYLRVEIRRVLTTTPTHP
ncbi:MAG TPA: hypothetical protein VIS10_05580 [Anaerolineales bacterium]